MSSPSRHSLTGYSVHLLLTGLINCNNATVRKAAEQKIYCTAITEPQIICIASRKALGPTQPPIQWVPGALSLGVKRPVREADHSHPSSAEVKWVELYRHSPNTPTWHGAQLKHRDNFTFMACDEVLWETDFVLSRDRPTGLDGGPSLDRLSFFGWLGTLNTRTEVRIYGCDVPIRQ
jgi:hypothetical protein